MSGFFCGILKGKNRVWCWKSSSLKNYIQNGSGNMNMVSFVVGGSHVCGLNIYGFIVCKNENISRHLNAPLGMTYKSIQFLFLGTNHSCAIKN